MTLNRNAFSSDDSFFVRISPKGIIQIIVATIASKSQYLTLRQRHNSSLKTSDIGFDFDFFFCTKCFIPDMTTNFDFGDNF